MFFYFWIFFYKGKHLIWGSGRHGAGEVAESSTLDICFILFLSTDTSLFSKERVKGDGHRKKG